MKIGSGYKTGCWITARCNEVETLQLETMERYLNMMARQICQQVTMPRIEVQAQE